MKKILLGIILLVLALIIIYGVTSYVSPETIYKAGIAAECRQAGLTEKSIKAAGHEVSYLEGGQGETVLLIHGFTADKSNWTRMARYLTPSYHVVAIDMPGFGKTGMQTDQSYDISSQAERIQLIADALKLDKFHIAGNSMGGCISAKYAEIHPEQLLSLGLYGTGCVCSAEKSELHQLWEKGRNPFKIKTYEDYEGLLNMAFVKAPFMPASIKRYIFKKQQTRQAGYDRIMEDLRADWYCMDKESDNRQTDTFIIWGDKDRFCHVSSVEILEKKFPKHQSIILKDCGHIPMFERPKDTADHYLNFLKSL